MTLPTELILEPGPEVDELLVALEQSGMRRLNCEGCGCDMLTRSDSNKCPPCRELEATAFALHKPDGST